MDEGGSSASFRYLKAFGLHADWRRSFITTDTNPYYDSFIRWQFRKLQAAGRIAFGKRPTVYSIRDGQACMDHDRASGEGKGPQEYTLIKMRLHDDGLATLVDRVPDLAPARGADGGGAAVFLVAATLRPETMYGQTNCFVLPSGDYGAYRLASGEIFVMSEHAARNMAHQAQDNTMVGSWWWWWAVVGWLVGGGGSLVVARGLGIVLLPLSFVIVVASSNCFGAFCCCCCC